MALLFCIVYRRNADVSKFLPTVCQEGVSDNQNIGREGYRNKHRTSFIYIEYLFEINNISTSELDNSKDGIIIGFIESNLTTDRLELTVNHRL